MIRISIFVLVSSLLATGAWAGPPGENTHGSTTTTISAAVGNVDQCLVSALAAKSDSDTGVTANALADALSNITVDYDGDVTLDLTRHGKHGAVHQVDLTGSMDNGTLFVQSAASSAQTDATADASASAAVDAEVHMIAQAVATLFQGIDFDIDLGVIDITVKAGSVAQTEVNMNSDAYAESRAFALASAAASSDAAATASATGGGDSASDSSFYVQGANIEEFNAQLNLASGMIVDVQTDVLAQAFADAMATSLAHALARDSVEAEAKAELSFEYDLPVLGSGSLPIVTDSASATKAAQKIVDAREDIVAHAKAMAESSASTFANSTVNLILSVQYENLPGTEDLLVSSAVGNLVLNCNQDLVNANADAQAESN